MHQNTALSLSWQQCKDSHKVEQAVFNFQGYSQNRNSQNLLSKQGSGTCTVEHHTVLHQIGHSFGSSARILTRLSKQF